MQQAQHVRIVSFIWWIAGDVLRDVFVCGKHRDIILPAAVIRRIDALASLLEPEGIRSFLEREVLPEASDAWLAEDSAKISCTRYFYTLRELRPLFQIEAEIRALEVQPERLLD